MAKVSAGAGNILHAGAVRLRVTGSGNLVLHLRSLQDVNNEQLASLVMEASTNVEPVQLANFTDQRIQLEGKTVDIDETFSISKIVIFAKITAASYPQ